MVQFILLVVPFMAWMIVTLILLSLYPKPELSVGVAGVLLSIWLTAAFGTWTRTFHFSHWLYTSLLHQRGLALLVLSGAVVVYIIVLRAAIIIGLPFYICFARTWTVAASQQNCSIPPAEVALFADLLSVFCALGLISVLLGHASLMLMRREGGDGSILTAIADARAGRQPARVHARPGHFRVAMASMFLFLMGTSILLLAVSHLPWFQADLRNSFSQEITIEGLLRLGTWMILLILASLLAYSFVASLRPSARRLLESPGSRCVLFLRSFAERRLLALERTCSLALSDMVCSWLWVTRETSVPEYMRCEPMRTTMNGERQSRHLCFVRLSSWL